VVANIAGLGDATEPEAVGHAVTRGVYVLLHTIRARRSLMFRFVRITLGQPALAGERRNVSSASP
jgi:hypothetical protein